MSCVCAKEYLATLENLTAVQRRCTELLEETRRLRPLHQAVYDYFQWKWKADRGLLKDPDQKLNSAWDKVMQQLVVPGW